MLITYPEGDASVPWWSNIEVPELGALSGIVAFAFKTAFTEKKIGNEVMLIIWQTETKKIYEKIT